MAAAEEIAAAAEAKAAGANNSNASRRLNPQLPGFRCTCYRTGDNHSFQSMEVACAVGGAIQDYFGWNVDLKNHDIEVSVLCLFNLFFYVLLIST